MSKHKTRTNTIRYCVSQQIHQCRQRHERGKKSEDGKMQERRSHCASFVRFDTKTLTRFEYLKSNASRRRVGPPTRSCNLRQKPRSSGQLNGPRSLTQRGSMEAPSPLTPPTDERRPLGLAHEFAVPGKVMARRGMDSIHALLALAPGETREGANRRYPIGAPSRARRHDFRSCAGSVARGRGVNHQRPEWRQFSRTSPGCPRPAYSRPR